MKFDSLFEKLQKLESNPAISPDNATVSAIRETRGYIHSRFLSNATKYVLPNPDSLLDELVQFYLTKQDFSNLKAQIGANLEFLADQEFKKIDPKLILNQVFEDFARDQYIELPSPPHPQEVKVEKPDEKTKITESVEKKAINESESIVKSFLLSPIAPTGIYKDGYFEYKSKFRTLPSTVDTDKNRTRFIAQVLEMCISYHEFKINNPQKFEKLASYVKAGVSVEFYEDGYTPLHIASHFKYADLIVFLVLNGADINSHIKPYYVGYDDYQYTRMQSNLVRRVRYRYYHEYDGSPPPPNPPGQGMLSEVTPSELYDSEIKFKELIKTAEKARDSFQSRLANCELVLLAFYKSFPPGHPMFQENGGILRIIIAYTADNWVDKTEVSNEEYQHVTQNPSFFGRLYTLFVGKVEVSKIRRQDSASEDGETQTYSFTCPLTGGRTLKEITDYETSYADSFPENIEKSIESHFKF